MTKPIPGKYQESLAATFIGILSCGSALYRAVERKDRKGQEEILSHVYDVMEFWVEPEMLKDAAFELQRRKLEHTFSKKATQTND